jgi:uncharacterized protein
MWIGNILYNSLSDQLIQFENNEVDDLSYFLDNLDKFEKEYPSIFKKFEQLGFIIPIDFNELDYIFYQNRMEFFLNKQYHLTINPTLECNYRCWYCCVEDMGTKYECRRMDDKTVQKIKNHLQFMIEKEHINCLHLDWFGGEPLMYFQEVILPISKYGLKISKKNNIPFSNHATTNAYYIDDKMINDFNHIKLNSFQIPIDGSEKKHNSIKNMNGIGHYKQIIHSINSLCENIEGIRITLRINYDAQTLKTILSIIDDIKIDNRNKIVVDFQRVWQVPINIDESGNNELLLKSKKAFEDAGFRTLYFAFSHKRFKCCYADSFYHRAINYDGKIFKCTARDYSDDLSIGSLNEDGCISFNYNMIFKMFADTTFKNEKCLNCNRLPLCFGPCIQKYYETKIGKKSFQCLHQNIEISLEEYIKERGRKQLEKLKLTI